VSISWNSRIIADVSFKGLYGRPVMGGYSLRFSIGFEVTNWTEDQDYPTPSLAHAPVNLAIGANNFLGYAVPEAVIPFRASPYSSSTALLFDLVLNASAMEAIEAARNGGDIAFKIQLVGSISRTTGNQPLRDEVTCRVAQSEWLRVLRECNYGRCLLYEIPVTPAGNEDSSLIDELARARHHFSLGHYRETVACCRLVLESLTQQLDQVPDLKRAAAIQGGDKRSMTIIERELFMRQAAIHFAHPAHHPGQDYDASFDRADAQMLLGITASLVSRALTRGKDASPVSVSGGA